MLKERLVEVSNKYILPEPTDNSDPSWFGFLLTVKENAGFNREDIVAHLESNGIQTRMLFSGNLLKHPCFDEMRNKKESYRVIGELKNTDIITNRTFWVGVYPGMTKDMIKFMIQEIKEFTKFWNKMYN